MTDWINEKINVRTREKAERSRKKEERAREEERRKVLVRIFDEECTRKKEVCAKEEEVSTRRKEERTRKKARMAEESTRNKETIHRPGPHYVFCGRWNVNHTGNVSFGKEATKLRERYKSSSNYEKFVIGVFLVDVVRERGGRFLKRDRSAMVRGGVGLRPMATKCTRRRCRRSVKV